jgi:hypothetical protein
MSGFFRRMRARRAGPDGEAADAPAPDDATAAANLEAQRAERSDVPAGADPHEMEPRRAARRRGSARRRLRRLERLREAHLRDLGGFVLELHRRDQADEPRRKQVLAEKLERLRALDDERAGLREQVGAGRELTLREPGLGGSCPGCGELHGSTDRFCPGCGVALTERAKRAEPGPSAAPAPPAPTEETDAMERAREHVAAAQATEPLAGTSAEPGPAGPEESR